MFFLVGPEAIRFQKYHILFEALKANDLDESLIVARDLTGVGNNE